MVDVSMASGIASHGHARSSSVSNSNSDLELRLLRTTLSAWPGVGGGGGCKGGGCGGSGGAGSSPPPPPSWSLLRLIEEGRYVDALSSALLRPLLGRLSTLESFPTSHPPAASSTDAEAPSTRHPPPPASSSSSPAAYYAAVRMRVRELLRDEGCDEGGGEGQEEEAEESARLVLLAGAAALLLFAQANVTGPQPVNVPLLPHLSEEDAKDLQVRARNEPSAEAAAAVAAQRRKLGEPEEGAAAATAVVSAPSSVQQWATAQLMARGDGSDVVGACKLPQYLLLSQELLVPPLFLHLGEKWNAFDNSSSTTSAATATTMAAAANPPRDSRSEKVAAAVAANPSPAPHPHPPAVGPLLRLRQRLRLLSRSWWAARALLLHQRLLCDRSPTLRSLLVECTADLLRCFGNPPPAAAAEGLLVGAAAQVEVGMVELAYGHVDTARHCFEKAATLRGFRVQLTGAMGFRTIHQVEPTAQMVLDIRRLTPPITEEDKDATSMTDRGQQGDPSTHVRRDTTAHADIGPDASADDGAHSVPDGRGSAGCGGDGGGGAATAAATAADGAGEAKRRSLAAEFDAESDILMVPRLVGANGVRDGDAVANTTTSPAAARTDNAAERDSQQQQQQQLQQQQLQQRLSNGEQVVVLALGVAAVKNVPHDDMRGWEVAPYVEAITAQASKSPLLPVIHAACQLQRVRWEKLRSHTRQRALAGITQLVEDVEEYSDEEPTEAAAAAAAASVMQRMQCAFAVWLPSYPALKKECGELLVSCGCVGEALRIFEDMEMWDNVIVCYQLLDKRAAATDLISRRLLVTPDDPRLWCSLGDLNNDSSCYEKAWQVSRQRFSRAQRSLARMAQNRKDFTSAIQHWEAALKLNPLYGSGWFSLGYAALKVEDVGKALHAFTRSVQMDPDNGESWNNIAALNLRQRRFPEAFKALQEALKYKRDSWHMWDNLAQVAVQVGRYSQAVHALEQSYQLTGGKRVDLTTARELVERVEAWRNGEESHLETREQEGAQGSQPQEADEEKAAEQEVEQTAEDAELDALLAVIRPLELARRQPEDQAIHGQPDHLGALNGAEEEEEAEPETAEANSGENRKGSSVPCREREKVEAELRKLLGKVASAGHAGPGAWELLGRLLAAVGEKESAAEALLKHVRGLQGSSWRSSKAAFEEFVRACVRWADVCVALAEDSTAATADATADVKTLRRRQLASARLQLSSLLKQAQDFKSSPDYEKAEMCLRRVTDYEKMLE